MSLGFFQSFGSVIVYYDNVQALATDFINTVLCAYNPEKKVCFKLFGLNRNIDSIPSNAFPILHNIAFYKMRAREMCSLTVLGLIRTFLNLAPNLILSMSYFSNVSHFPVDVIGLRHCAFNYLKIKEFYPCAKKRLLQAFPITSVASIPFA